MCRRNVGWNLLQLNCKKTVG